MKKLYCILCLLPAFASGQDQNQNYIKNKTYKAETTVSVASTSAVQALENITYFDGLGRPIQQRAHRQSNSGKDIVTHIEYDAFGRQTKEFLPFVSQTASLQYDANGATEVQSFYGSPTLARTGSVDFEAISNPFSEKLLEASPLSRVLKVAAPGVSWAMSSGHEIKTEYVSNTASDNVRKYTATAGALTNGYYPASLSQQGNYTDGTLYKTIVKDENWTSGNNHTVQEFKNKSGQIVLTRRYGNSSVSGDNTEGWHDTYYVYDQYGNLSFVMPPLSDGSGSSADLDGLCYQYCYDKRNRLVEKKLPGKQWEFIIYDRLDRVVATGPALSPFSNFTSPNNVGWLIMKYDIYNRTAYTGWMQSANVTSAGRNEIQAVRDQQVSNLNESKTSSSNANTVNGVSFYYTNLAWPSGNTFHVLTANYYDSYNLLYPAATFNAVEGQNIYYNGTVKPKGLPTETWTRVLETSMLVTGEYSSTFYDSKARPIRTRTTNYLGGYTQRDSKLDFSGMLLYSKTTHKRVNADAELLIREDFAYTDQGRLLSQTHKINSGNTELLAKNTYNELGQLIKKDVGNTESMPLQRVNYSYNSRGWLKEINKTQSLTQTGDPADLFAFKLSYEATEYGPGLFNGNIAETYWRTASDNKLRKYLYEYDSMNRLTGANYQKPGGVPAPNSYGENQSYDKNGNITRLDRYGEFDDAVVALMIDELSYTYEPNSNRLAKVTDATNNPHGFGDDSDGTNDTADDYAYDANGNMVYDQNKGITNITYNHLNLPVKILFATGNSIEYLYTAAGSKVKKTIVENPKPVRTQEYSSGIVYGNGVLEAIPTSEGYVKNTVTGGSNVFNYVFNYADHLGNVRLSYTKNQSTGALTILEENNYYPFGLKHKNYNASERIYNKNGLGIPPSNVCAACPVAYKYNYKFNGQELQEDLGLNIMAMDYRQYDSAIGRFFIIDPFAELSYSMTPNKFAYNNPIYWNDPLGLFETKDDAIKYAKEHGIRTGWFSDNKIEKGADGIWSINNGEEGTSIFAANVNNAEGLGVNAGDIVTSAFAQSESKSSSTNSFGWFTIWGSDRSGSTDGLKGTTYESVDASKIPSFSGSRARNIGSGGLLAWFKSLFTGAKDVPDLYIKYATYQAINEKSNTATMEVQNKEPVIVSSSIKVVSYTFHLNDSTVTKNIKNATYKGEASEVKKKIDSVQGRNESRASDKGAWLKSWQQ